MVIDEEFIDFIIEHLKVNSDEKSEKEIMFNKNQIFCWTVQEIILPLTRERERVLRKILNHNL